MPWVVEDGTLVTGANTYISTSDAIAYGAARGVTISGGEIDVLMQQAMDYLETRCYQGSLTEEDQALQQPREYVYVYGYEQTAAQIVARMAKAECELIIAYANDYDPTATITRDQQIIQEGIGPLTTTYSPSAAENPILIKVATWLDPLLDSGGGYNFRVERSYG